MNALQTVTRCLAGLALLRLAACGSDSTAPAGEGPAISVAVVPATANLLTSGSQDFTATVTHDPTNSGVTWCITGCSGGPAACGSLSAVTTTQATYTAPATVPPGTLGVTATSISDNSKSGTAGVAITAIATGGQIAAGGAHTCGLTGAGTAYCWGDNYDGELGNGTNTGPDSCSSYSCSIMPIAVSGGLSFRALAPGGAHTCGLSNSGAAYCWGRNEEGQLGVGTAMGPETCGIGPAACSTLPLAVTGGLDFDALATSGWHTCGLTRSGAAYCWGLNDFGQLGNGSTTNSSTPVAVSGALNFSALASGQSRVHTCGLTSAGAAYCWGANSSGQLGDGSTNNSSVPVAVSGGLSFRALATGTALGATQSGHTCGLTSSGAAYCWGLNNFGQLGNGSTTNSSTPVAVSGGLTLSTFATGRDHSCGLTSVGAAYCWGGNYDGQLGTGSTTSSATPVAVSGGLSFTALATGEFHTCGLTSAGAAYCWGRNFFGQLGDGTTTNSSVPVRVAGQP
jgi:alpha-tubulin suppressor-like RCC1 family protein